MRKNEEWLESCFPLMKCQSINANGHEFNQWKNNPWGISGLMWSSPKCQSSLSSWPYPEYRTSIDMWSFSHLYEWRQQHNRNRLKHSPEPDAHHEAPLVCPAIEQWIIKGRIWILLLPLHSTSICQRDDVSEKGAQKLSTAQLLPTAKIGVWWRSERRGEIWFFAPFQLTTGRWWPRGPSEARSSVSDEPLTQKSALFYGRKFALIVARLVTRFTTRGR